MRKNLYRFLAAGVILAAGAGMAGCSEKKMKQFLLRQLLKRKRRKMTVRRLLIQKLVSQKMKRSHWLFLEKQVAALIWESVITVKD